MHKEHFQVLESLYSNEPILSTKCDKESGIVVLYRSDYIQKMSNILDDKAKFLSMGSVNLHGNMAKNEQKLQKQLLDLVNQNILAHDDRTGSQHPCIYGLPNTHVKRMSHFGPFYL